MASTKDHGPATQLALAHARILKPEHQELLGKLVADAGMAPATLETLVEHLFDEEDPRLEIALRRARAGVPVDVASAALARPGATVGSLRRDHGVSGTPGGLRRR